jgi:DNA polymerase-1
MNEIVRSKRDFDKVIEILSKQEVIGLDLETSGLQWWANDTIVGIGLGYWEDNVAAPCTYYIPVSHTGHDTLYLQEVRKGLDHILCNRNIIKVGANIKFDIHFLNKFKFKVHPVEDVQVLARLLRTNWLQVGLDALVKYEFNATHDEWHELIKWCRKNKIKMNQRYVEPGALAKAPFDLVGAYCGADVRWTLELYYKYIEEIKKDPILFKFYKSIEKALVYAVTAMESNGISIDKKYLNEIGSKLSKEIKDTETRIYNSAGCSFNINSGKQLKEIFPKFGVLPELRKRKKKDATEETASFDKMTLQKYEGKIPFVDLLLKYRGLTKKLGSFVEVMLEEAGPGKKIYASIKQEAARTGRLSAALLMTLPREEEDSKYSIRKAIVPFNDHSALLSIDYSQIEYCLLAHFSQDPVLLKIFRSGGDFHTVTASQLFGIPPEKVSKKQRAMGKKFNFAQLYGSGIEHLAKQCGLSVKVTTKFVQKYGAIFPKVIRFKQIVQRHCEMKGGIRNVFGRYRSLESKFAYRAVNTLIQSTAADILKIAIIRINKYLIWKKSKLLFPVHDEIVINWDMADGMIIGDIIKLMTKFENKGKPVFTVPIEVEASVCKSNWASKEEISVGTVLEAVVEKLEREDDLPELQRNRTFTGKRKVEAMQVSQRANSKALSGGSWD